MNYENSITLFVPRGKVGRVRQVSERASEKSASLNEMRTASEAESKLFSVQPIWVRASRVRTRAPHHAGRGLSRRQAVLRRRRRRGGRPFPGGRGLPPLTTLRLPSFRRRCAGAADEEGRKEGRKG